MQPTDSIAITESTGSTAALGPIGGDERIEFVDALRGFALFGILLVNMAWFAQPLAIEFVDLPRDLPRHDRLAEMGIEFLAEGKFYSIFSMLFGFGMAIQMGRAQARGRSFVRNYVFRLLALLLIAAAHITLLWFGDILHAYALLGFVLLLFRNRRQVTLLIWAAIFLLVPILLYTGLTFLSLVANSLNSLTPATTAPASIPAMTQPAPADSMPADSMPSDSQPAGEKVDRLTASARKLLPREHAAYSGRSFVTIVNQRLEDFCVSSVLLLTIYPVILTMFLFGVWLARAGILHDPAGHRGWLKRAALAGIGLGLPLNGLHVWLSALTRQEGNDWVWLVGIPVGLVAGPTLALGYVSALALWFQSASGHAVLSLLAPAGRMALSNYLLQSIVCTTLCYGYGFGLFGKIGPLAGMGIAIVLFASQAALSHAWLRGFRFGPAEWLWRSLTYGRIQPLRRG